MRRPRHGNIPIAAAVCRHLPAAFGRELGARKVNNAWLASPRGRSCSRQCVLNYHQLVSTAISLAYVIKTLANDMVGVPLCSCGVGLFPYGDVVWRAKLPCLTNGQILWCEEDTLAWKEL